MTETFVQDKNYIKQNFALEPLIKGEYENCEFKNCDFSNVDLSSFHFSNCRFVGCNLSLVKLVKTIFRDTKFIESKMLGIQFSDCSEFGLSFSFEQCVLNHASFFKTKIKKTIFANSQIQDVDFSWCDLSAAYFLHCDLFRATFDNTNLEKADLSTAFNYQINPAQNKVKKAKFSALGLAGLLTQYDLEIVGEV